MNWACTAKGMQYKGYAGFQRVVTVIHLTYTSFPHQQSPVHNSWKKRVKNNKVIFMQKFKCTHEKQIHVRIVGNVTDKAETKGMWLCVCLCVSIHVWYVVVCVCISVNICDICVCVWGRQLCVCLSSCMWYVVMCACVRHMCLCICVYTYVYVCMCAYDVR